MHSVKNSGVIRAKLLKTKKMTKKEKVAYERSLMTNSLRFLIMKRDGFKCGYCGASPQRDGVVLHIDHLTPIRDGGKTTPSNLLTACNLCNNGKGSTTDMGRIPKSVLYLENVC